MTPSDDPRSLLSRCRSDLARPRFEEAVRAYEAGLYCQCISTTWQAVVLDYVSKLVELRLAGEKEAKGELDRYERILHNGNVTEAQRFEREVIQRACDVHGSISQAERLDFERLFNDRHRASHPVMNTLDEPFEPSAILALSHMTAAVAGILSKPAVYGRAALQHLERLVASPHFATNEPEAIRQLRDSPLGSARPSLVKSFIHSLVSAFLKGEVEGPLSSRQVAAVLATKSLHPDEFHNALKKALQANLRGLGYDAKRLLQLLWYVPDAWPLLSDCDQTALARRVRTGPGDAALLYAFRLEALQGLVFTRYAELPDELVLKVCEPSLREEYLPLLTKVVMEGELQLALKVMETWEELVDKLALELVVDLAERLLRLQNPARLDIKNKNEKGAGAFVAGVIGLFAALHEKEKLARIHRVIGYLLKRLSQLKGGQSVSDVGHLNDTEQNLERRLEAYSEVLKRTQLGAL